MLPVSALLLLQENRLLDKAALFSGLHRNLEPKNRRSGDAYLDLSALSDRYDRLWTKAERLVEAFLDGQIAALEAMVSEHTAAVPAATSAGKDKCRGNKATGPSKSRPGASARSALADRSETHGCIEGKASPSQPSAPAFAAMREIYIAVQCLKRIHEGRQAALLGGTNAVQPFGSSDHAKAVAEEISRRIREMYELGNSNGNDETAV